MTAKRVLGMLAVVGAVSVSVPALARGGGQGLDVAPGGGHYTARDILNELPKRMSHPYVGEPRAPSFVVRGSHRLVNRYEMVMTARLNLAQLHR